MPANPPPPRTTLCQCVSSLVPEPPRHNHQKLIKNVAIFTGESADLIVGHNVVVEGHKIHSIVPAEGCDERGYDAVIDGGGGFLTPGLIDCHWHAMMPLSIPTLLSSTKEYVAAVVIAELSKILRRGVTTLRDAAGEVFGVKQAIDEGVVEGPRIYPSGAMLCQYSGHGDFRSHKHLAREWGGPINPADEAGISLCCNGADQVLAGTRHQLYRGASQIKLAVSGGVCSFGDPLYVNEFLEEEIRAAVRAAEDYGTYVMVHCHSTNGAQRALKAGAKSFEHVSCIDEETVKMLAEAGAVATVQPLTCLSIATTYPKGDPRQVKAQYATDNTKQMLQYARKYGLMLAWGTDLLDSEENRDQQLKDLAMRTDFGFTSAELMIQATGNAGKTVALCGKRNPYGKLGVIEAGAMADILIYSKNPLEDIKVVENFQETLKLVIKDGDIVQNEYPTDYYCKEVAADKNKI